MLPIEDVPHPSEFIASELVARGWDKYRLAFEMIKTGPMMDEYNKALMVLNLYFEIGPDKPNMRLGVTTEAFSRAFDVPKEFFLNLERGWLKSKGIEP